MNFRLIKYIPKCIAKNSLTDIILNDEKSQVLKDTLAKLHYYWNTFYKKLKPQVKCVFKD